MNLLQQLRLLPLLALPALLPAQATFIAFDAPTGVSANQFITNPLGLDFNVNTPIQITALGVFDSGQNGLAFSQVVRIYDRNTGVSVVNVTIPAGTSATLIGGSRFVTLLTPLNLPAGFLGSVVAEINLTDGNWNSGGGGGVSVLNTGGGAISYVGGGRVSDFGPAVYPSRLDGGPANRYLAGSFIFTTIPEPAEWMLLAGGLATLVIRARRTARRSGAR